MIYPQRWNTLKKRLKLSSLKGRLTVIVNKDEEEETGGVIICGDRIGLKSLGELLIAFSDVDQMQLKNIPMYESAHVHLDYGVHIGENNIDKERLILSRLDTKDGKIKDYYLGNIKEEREISIAMEQNCDINITD